MLRAAVASMASAFALTGVAYAQNAQTAETTTTPEPAAAAADRNTDDRTSYDAAFFAQFHPQNALDMVNQTPNFSLNGGDDRRGFSGAVGNLLIDGRRPVAKSQGVSSLLQQIPASQVLRIEVLRGAAVAGDASGQAVLVNVVRVPSAGSGVYSAGGEWNQNHIAPQGDVTWSGRNGDIDYGIGANFYSQIRSLPGYRQLFDAAGNRTGSVDTPSPRSFRELAINGNFAMSVLGGRLSTTEQIDVFQSKNRNSYDTFNEPGHIERDFLENDTNEHQRSFEIGANYDRDLGAWDLSLVGLINRRHYVYKESDDDVNFLTPVNSFAFDIRQQRNSGESILRGSLARDFSAQHHLEFGIEGAINTLDAKFAIAGQAPPPDANVNVEEHRVEAFASYTWRPDTHWSVESRLAEEVSTLTFTGDTNQSVDLKFLKPSIQVSRSFDNGNQVRLRAYRDVGQLNFDDFVSAVSVADNLINGGNPDLVPETAYRLSLGGDLKLPLSAALTFELTHHWISDAADLVEIIIPPNPPDPEIRFDAPGNIGSGWANSLTIHYTMPFAPLIPGAKLTLDGTFWQTRVTDPVTGLRRSISGRPDAQINAEFRQDLNDLNFSWGLEYQNVTEQQTYRHDETNTQQEGPYLDVFVETTALKGLKVRGTLANTMRSPVLRQRNFFVGDRNGPPLRSEHRERAFDDAPWFVLTVSGAF
ncbi:MAG: outer membrane beta-barrel protein [Terricaulis sp.]